MTLNVISNYDDATRVKYTIARVIYAQSNASSLKLVHALTSLISNASRMRGCAPIDIATDVAFFDVDDTDTNINTDGAPFQMCLRVVGRMLKGNLPDCCCGATRFHRDGQLPEWAVNRGYIAEIDGFLFYK